MQAADGCSVELYRLLRYRGELEDMLDVLRPGATVLELGCGVGRLTRRMLQLGCHVTGVDNSSAMLGELPAGAVGVLSDIETLALGSTFQVVMLASNLINHPVSATREAFIDTARRHSVPGSHLLVERHDPEWLCRARVGPLGTADGISMHLETLSRHEAVVSMTLRYQSNHGVWRHSFSTQAMTQTEVEALLSGFGFGSLQWFGADRRWVSAVAR